MTYRLSFEVQQAFAGFDLRDTQSMPNKSLERIPQEVTSFACQNPRHLAQPLNSVVSWQMEKECSGI